MGGWSRNTKMNLGLLALIAYRRARAEAMRKAGPAAPVVPKQKKRGWFG